MTAPALSVDSRSPLRMAVIGGGISGLSAVHRLIELASQQSQPVQIVLFEAGDRLGGAFGSERIGDYLIERGADSFITNKPGAIELCRRLGMESRLIGTDPRFRRALVLFHKRPVPVPAGFNLLAPSQLWPVLTTPLLSWRGKLRLAREPFIAPRKEAGDESLASFVRRRLGDETLQRIVQPLVGGIYTSDPERLSLRATLPRFPEMERQHGSLIRGLQQQSSTTASRSASGARYELFMTPQGGMQELVDTLASAISGRCEIRLKTPVQSLTRRERWQIDCGQPEPEEFDGLVLALRAPIAAKLLEEESPDCATALRQIEHASSAIVVTGHDLNDIKHPLDASGLVIPHGERRRILAVSFLSRKFPSRAPEGKVILRTFVGGALQPGEYHRSDEEIINTVLLELRMLLGVGREPEFAVITRYPEGMPQFTLGHLDRIAEIRRSAADLPGLALAGNYLDGVGIPDCVTSGEQGAAQLMNTLCGASASPAASELKG